ncbi:HAD-IA family hydrolase [Bacillus sp. FSL W8-0223]|uniref:HAD family hydrolase n=1 Tax=Bacillus sp. FSL W8-0223 TaxID=2954595 RepID=UPI0030F60FEE
MEKKFVWFDLGYTLFYQQREDVYQQFLAENGIYISLEKIERAYHLTDKYFMREYPSVLGKDVQTFYPWYLGVLNFKLGLHFHLSRQSERMLEMKKPIEQWRPFAFVNSVLTKLKRHSYGLGVISNWDHSARELLERHHLTAYFDHIIISSEVGVEKPDAAIFEIALKDAGVSGEECIYVGDNYYDDVVGSSKVRMKALLINRFNQEGIEEIRYPHTIRSIEEVPDLLNKMDLLL